MVAVVGAWSRHTVVQYAVAPPEKNTSSLDDVSNGIATTIDEAFRRPAIYRMARQTASAASQFCPRRTGYIHAMDMLEPMLRRHVDVFAMPNVTRQRARPQPGPGRGDNLRNDGGSRLTVYRVEELRTPPE